MNVHQIAASLAQKGEELLTRAKFHPLPGGKGDITFSGKTLAQSLQGKRSRPGLR